MPDFDVNEGYIGCARRVSVAARAGAWQPSRPTRAVMPHRDRLTGFTS